MQTTLLFSIALACVFVAGCASTAPSGPSLHDKAHQAREPYVDVAANLNLKFEGDLFKLYDSLAAAGFRCGMRAMSVNTAQVVVELADFERAKTAVTEIIGRDKLTLRVYKSADFAKSPERSLLEVWDKGEKIREEPFKIYN